MDKATLDKIANVLVLVGGLNWGLVGLFAIDPIEEILGFGLARLVYVLVGVSALYLSYSLVQKSQKKTK